MLPLSPQEQAIVRLPRRVRALLIDDDHVGQPAQIQQPMPVRGGPRQPRYFEGEDRSDAALCHVLSEALEAAPPLRGLPAAPQVVVHHLHPLGRPTELDRALAQGVLAYGRLMVVVHLP
jgi:hypothetical protein